ncbi:hypothetical protein [Kutzneria sp. NPDC052558]|uniref:terpene synthase family protein n=1 Tax=Kutzneria sp. NPDC052558 TaxID=3364121 RepID=UPI0037CB4A6B
MTDDQLIVELPPRYCPVPVATHPDADLLESRGADWLSRYGLGGPRLWANDCAGFYGRIMPAAATERLQMAVDWCFLMFAFDDINCDEVAPSTAGRQFVDIATRVVRALEVPDARLDGDVFLEPVRDLARRAHKFGTPTQVRRLVEGHRAWYLGVLWELRCKLADVTPSLNDYAHLRQHTAGGLATTSWIEIVDGAEIPAAELDSPAVRALSELAFTIAAFDDDLFSYGKETWFARRETTPSDCKLNLIDIMAREPGVENALAESVELVNRMTYRFVQLRDAVLPSASEPLRHYLDCLSRLLRGNLEWGLQAQRYRNPDGRSPDAVHTVGSWTSRPPADAEAPPAIPSATWWWDPELTV